MRAVRFDEFGGPDVLHVVDVDPPHPGPGEIRIAVRAAGVNGIDWKIRAGYTRAFLPVELPAGTGLDGAGIVDAVGEDVHDVAVGDAVLGRGRATVAEQAVLTEWVAKPIDLPFEEAAGYPLPVETAERMLALTDVGAGAAVVVSGAAGGVGSTLVQFALARGAVVIGTASEANHDHLRGLGAVPTTYGPGLPARVAALSARPITHAFDVAGHGVLPDLVELTGDPGRVVTIADFGGSVPGVVVSAASGDHRPALEHALRLRREGRFRLPVSRAFPLEAAGEAHAVSAQGHVAGRTVITVAP